MKRLGLYLIYFIIGILLYYLVNTLCNCIQSGNGFNIGCPPPTAAGGGTYTELAGVESEMGMTPSPGSKQSTNSEKESASIYDVYISNEYDNKILKTDYDIKPDTESKRFHYSTILELYEKHDGYIHNPEITQKVQLELLKADILSEDEQVASATEEHTRIYDPDARNPIPDILLGCNTIAKAIKGCFLNCCISSEDDTLWTKVLIDANNQALEEFLIYAKVKNIYSFMFFDKTVVEGRKSLMAAFVYPVEGEGTVEEIYEAAISEIQSEVLKLKYTTDQDYLNKLDALFIETVTIDPKARVDILNGILTIEKLDKNIFRIISQIIKDGGVVIKEEVDD